MKRLITKAERLASRYIPKESAPVEHPEGFGVAYIYECAGKFYAVAYRGTASKSEWHTWFRTVDQRAEYLAKWFQGLTASAAYRGRLKSQRAAHRCTWTVGTILSGQWGYDQTNVEFWQVVELSPSGKTALIRPVAHDNLEESAPFMQGRSVPAKNVFTGPAIKVRVQGWGDGSSHCAPTGRCFSLSEWDGAPERWTAYA